VPRDDPDGLVLPPPEPPLNVVLVEPLIPQNTGNIARLCVGAGAVLHLVEPLGFDISEKAVRRAGLDYWEHLTLRVHPSWDALWDLPDLQRNRVFGTTKRAMRAYTVVRYRPGDWLVFGKETTGLDSAILDALGNRVVAVPRMGAVRSHNLGNTVSIVLYEALRQISGGFGGGER